MSNLNDIFKTFGLFFITAIFEILGCYFTWIVVKQSKSAFYIVASFICLAIFSYLLTIHPTSTGKTYAAYGSVYVATSFLWLYFMESSNITKYDILGVFVSLVGMTIIMLQPSIKL